MSSTRLFQCRWMSYVLSIKCSGATISLGYVDAKLQSSSPCSQVVQSGSQLFEVSQMVRADSSAFSCRMLSLCASTKWCFSPVPSECVPQANTLRPYLNAIRGTLDAALCLRNFPSQTVERHNKPEIETRWGQSHSGFATTREHSSPFAVAPISRSVTKTSDPKSRP